MFTCAYPGFAKKLKTLFDHGFSENEIDRIKFSLLDVTNGIFNKVDQDLEKIQQLDNRHHIIKDSSMSKIQKIYWLMEDCKRYGTLPFAGLARAGFIAAEFLRSLVDLKILSLEEKDAYMRSLDTVSSQLAKDTNAWQNGDLTKETLLEKYGHLRPGTYDITSPRYDEAFEHYFSSDSGDENQPSTIFFTNTRAKISHRYRSSEKMVSSLIRKTCLYF